MTVRGKTRRPAPERFGRRRCPFPSGRLGNEVLPGVSRRSRACPSPRAPGGAAGAATDRRGVPARGWTRSARKPGEAPGAGAHALQRRHGVSAVKALAVQGEDHARLEIVALAAHLRDEAGRRPAVDEPQGLPDPRLEPGLRHIEAAERALAVIEQEGFARNLAGRTAGLFDPRRHRGPFRSFIAPSVSPPATGDCRSWTPGLQDGAVHRAVRHPTAFAPRSRGRHPHSRHDSNRSNR